MNPRFAAFISYSHVDERWARWLHRSLERYRLPKRLAVELGRGRRLKPMFRDKEELATGDLTERLKQALADSATLTSGNPPLTGSGP